MARDTIYNGHRGSSPIRHTIDSNGLPRIFITKWRGAMLFARSSSPLPRRRRLVNIVAPGCYSCVVMRAMVDLDTVKSFDATFPNADCGRFGFDADQALL